MGTPLTKIPKKNDLSIEHSQGYINPFTYMRGQMWSQHTIFTSHNFQIMKGWNKTPSYPRAPTTLVASTLDKSVWEKEMPKVHASTIHTLW
jgi:hypothetical protein